MKRILNLFIFNVLVTSFGFAQTTQRTTFLNVLNNLAKTNNLELSYSSDLVNLNDSTEFVFSKNLDSCIVQVEKLSRLKIQINNSHLIVLPIPKLIHLSGLVIDSNTKETLPHAHLLIKNAGAGTITNQEGKFDFKISSQMAGNEIQFSFLGYKNGSFKIPNSDIHSIIVELEPKPYTLSDIYILPKGTQAVDFVKKAVKNIKRNYHRSTIQMEAFYRNTSFSNGKASQLIEAALLIEDKGINNTSTSGKIELQEIRKSSNYLIPRPKKYKFFEKFWGHKNFIHRCYNKNMVRFYRGDLWFKPLLSYNDFIYEFEGSLWLDSVKVYKIKYIWNALLPDGKRVTEHEQHGKTGGYFYIGAKDFAILKIEQKAWPGLDSPWKKLEPNQISKTPNEVCYQKINGKYYLKYITGISSPNGSSGEFENDNGNRENLIFKTRQWAEEILLVTQIQTDRKEFDKIKYREKLANDENSYRKKYTYNAEFWKNYNVLKENPIEEKFIKEMEWEKSLDMQFEENSLNDAQNK
jgi:hypothetical protein